MATSVLDRPHCTIRDAKAERNLLYFLTIGFSFTFALGVAGFINEWIFAFLKSILPDVTGGLIPKNAWVPAIVEPWTTKLLFAVVGTTVFFALVRRGRCLDFGPHRPWLGAAGGLVMGIAELYVKVFNRNPDIITPFFWEHPGFLPTMLPPLLLHTINGAIIVGVWLSVVNDGFELRDTITVLGAVATATGIHLVWNTWWVRQNWFWEWWLGLF